MKTKPINRINQTSLSGVLAKVKKPKKGKVPIHEKGERFLKGPVPWDWLVAASKISGSVLKVGVAIWFLAGVSKSNTIKLSNGGLEELGVGRLTKYRALEAMENAGLISVSQHSGNSPEITINPVGKPKERSQ